MLPGKMHTDELEIDAALVRRLLAMQFPQWADLSLVRVFSSGTDNALYRLGRDMVVRLPRIQRVVPGVEKELRWLPILAPHLPVTIPVPLGVGQPAEGYPCPWFVYRWLDGENPVVDHIADPDRLALDLVEFITAFHRLDLPGGPPTGQTLTMKDGFIRKAIAELGDRIDNAAVTAAWDAALTIPEWSAPPVWVHNDIAPGNILLVNGRLSAIIDFSGVGMGDPSVDIQVAWNLLPASVRNDFRLALGVDDATWARGRARALAQALVQLPYYWETNRPLAANARHVIGEVLKERSRET